MTDYPRLKMNMLSHEPLQRAHELAVRQNELYEAMQIVERCGASPELTEAVTRLGERLRSVQADMAAACREAIGEEPKKEDPKPQLYRVVWWQSMVQGMAQGETLEENVPAERLEARVADWRASLSGGIGVMVGSCPMSFIPAGDKRGE